MKKSMMWVLGLLLSVAHANAACEYNQARKAALKFLSEEKFTLVDPDGNESEFQLKDIKLASLEKNDGLVHVVFTANPTVPSTFPVEGEDALAGVVLVDAECKASFPSGGTYMASIYAETDEE